MALALTVASPGRAASTQELIGHYRDEQLAAISSITLPRVHLYDDQGRLIAPENWPRELDAVKRDAGDAFCCVSDAPDATPSNGPPADCKRIVYGTDVREPFAGLLATDGSPIRYEALSRHRYLLLDYHADWCAPCRSTKHALESFERTTAAADYAVVVIDMDRLPLVKKAHGP